MKIVYYEEKYLTECATTLLNHYNSEAYGCEFTEERALAYLQELVFKPRFIGFVLLNKEVVVGFAFCHLRTWDTTDELHIDEFVINEELRCKGLGSKLLSYIETYANSFFLTGMTATTNVIGLAQFYQKNDFLEHDITFLYKGLTKTT